MNKITLVVPCYNEEKTVEIFYNEAIKATKLIKDVEIIILFVNDGSNDSTLDIIKHLAEKDSKVKYVSFSRNFGKEAAIFAGLEHSDGDFTVIMDADLQDPPSLLPDMYKAVTTEGYDCAGSRRITRKGEPPIRSFFARCFYKIINRISDAVIVDGARDFQMMNRKAVNAILSMGEYNRFSKGIFGWIGFKKKWFEYENIERVAGETKWSFWKLAKYAIHGIITFSTAPLLIPTLLSIAFLVAGTVIAILSAIGIWGTFLYALICFASGAQLLSIGIIAQYLAKTYLETKHRPIYIVSETNSSVKNK